MSIPRVNRSAPVQFSISHKHSASCTRWSLFKVHARKDTKHTSANEISASTIAELMEHSVPMVLNHLRMNVEARITEFCNFFSQQFHAIDRVAKDDRLVYLQLQSNTITILDHPNRVGIYLCSYWDCSRTSDLREKCVEAVNLLSLFNKSIILCDTHKRELIHEIDNIWLP